MFDAAAYHVYRLMERDVGLHFANSPVGLDLARRVAYCKIAADPAQVVRPTPATFLPLDPEPLNEPSETEGSSQGGCKFLMKLRCFL